MKYETSAELRMARPINQKEKGSLLLYHFIRIQGGDLPRKKKRKKKDNLRWKVEGGIDPGHLTVKPYLCLFLAVVSVGRAGLGLSTRK